MICLVTGATGFVGKALSLALLNSGHTVTALSRRPAPELASAGAKTLQIDIACDVPDLSGIDVVFHTAAHVKMWGRYDDFYKTNVIGTEKLIDAAKKAGVKRFIYTSSPSVIADGTDLRDIDESYPYPKQYLANYPKTKAEAERKVIAAHSQSFRTLALRPHLIYGPGDTNLIPTILKKARSGRLSIIGDGKNKVDITHIDNCIAAHLSANLALEQNVKVGGRAYFISDGAPVFLWDWINEILAANSLNKIKRRVPKQLAYLIAWCAEILAGESREPLFTRFLISEMATDHYFNINAAKKMLGYAPKSGRPDKSGLPA